MKRTISRILILCIFLGSSYVLYTSQKPHSDKTKEVCHPHQNNQPPKPTSLSVPTKRRLKVNSGDELLFPRKKHTQPINDVIILD